ncbi:sugar phosphate isomerase/epimerase family protein [Halopelagius longus]|nr:sugar phosphate isomerase/epimerase [Halopelagius longus]
MKRRLRPAFQLHSVREFSDPLPEVIRRVGAAGFEGVEFAGRFRDADPDAVADALDETGVEPVAVHAELSAIEAAVEGENDLLDRCETVGCDRLVVPRVPSWYFCSRWNVRELSYRLTDLSHELDARDVDIGYHNVRNDLWPFLPDRVTETLERSPLPAGLATYASRGLAEFGRDDRNRIPDETGFWNLVARTAPDDLFFELDVGEVYAAGFDPVAAFEVVSGRVPTIHLRDVAPTGRFGAYEDVERGTGVVDTGRVLSAARRAGVEWVVYENELDAGPDEKLEDGAALVRQFFDDESAASASEGGASPTVGSTR